MGIFDFLRSKPAATGASANNAFLDTPAGDEETGILIQQAIAVFKGNPGYTPAQIIEGIKIFSRDELLATALYCFIPHAFCRIIFPEPAYATEFILIKKGRTVLEASFAGSRLFQRVMEESRKSYAFSNDQEKMLNILQHSAEFDALNKALQAGSGIGDLVFGPPQYSV